MQIVSIVRDNLHEMSNHVFWEKYSKKKYSEMSAAENWRFNSTLGKKKKSPYDILKYFSYFSQKAKTCFFEKYIIHFSSAVLDLMWWLSPLNKCLSQIIVHSMTS